MSFLVNAMTVLQQAVLYTKQIPIPGLIGGLQLAEVVIDNIAVPLQVVSRNLEDARFI